MSFVSISTAEREDMLQQIGVTDVRELFADIPADICYTHLPLAGTGLSEIEADQSFDELASRNARFVSFAGAGSYVHHVPPVVDQLALRSEFYTAYTPYQAEISQGTLTAIFEFQTMICRLTGMDVTNASMYDGATALAEAVLMACRAKGLDRFAVSEGVNGAFLEVLRTYAWASSLEMEIIPLRDGVTDTGWIQGRSEKEFAACVFQSPNRYGLIEDAQTLSTLAHEKSAYSIQTVTEALSLALLARPGDCGVDIVAGEGQSLGNYPGFGGPLLGLLAAKKEFLRRMPGRLVGRTTDEKGREAFILTLQAREQHIRREKATSNICSNEGLCALRAVIYMSLLGDNLRQLARLNHARASLLLRLLEAKGARRVFNGPFFNEICVQLPDAGTFRRLAADAGILAGTAVAGMDNVLLLCATELTSPAQIEQLASLL